MRILKSGHTYDLAHQDGRGTTRLQFVQRKPHHEPREGVLNQEVLRALIDRVQVLDRELPWQGNAQIVHHLRMALALHEARALVRKVEKGELQIELLGTGADGHIEHGRRTS